MIVIGMRSKPSIGGMLVMKSMRLSGITGGRSSPESPEISSS